MVRLLSEEGKALGSEEDKVLICGEGEVIE
jgi:hypothetical protein